MLYRWFAGVLLSLFVVAGCTGAAGQARRDAGRSSPIAVSTAPVQHISIQRSVDLAGTLVSPDQAKVSAEAAGVVESVSVRLGDNVARGQELVRLAPRELELALERAQSALRQTEAQLGMSGESSQPLPDDQIAAMRTARANLDDARTQNFVIAIFLAVTFIYMVLASQFNSFIYPFSIMSSLPLSVPAGLLALMAFGMTLNVYSAIGMLMLFGIVKKNSILQVDYTNTLRAQGMERHEAIVAANHVRLRPILMTTLSIIAGMLPIAFGRGAGAGSRASMAVTILGGQVLCLLLTLLVTPVVYSYFDDLREIDWFALVRRWTSIGVYGRRDSATQAD